MNRVLAFWIAVLLVFAGSFLIWTIANRNQPSLAGTSVEPDPKAKPEESAEDRPPLKEFELVDQLGRRVNSSDFAGQVWAASFFFSRCPSTCFQQNVMLQQLIARYADDGLQLASITCDPSYDSPTILSEYSNRFNADPDTWKFLTPPSGDADYLSRIGREMLGIVVDPSGGGAEPTHTDRVVLFDREGNKVGAYSVTRRDQFQKLKDHIEQLLPTGGEATTAEHGDEATRGASRPQQVEAG